MSTTVIKNSNTQVHGSNARNLPCIAIFISSQQKCYVFLIIAYVFSSTKLEKRAEQILPGSKGAGGERKEVGGQRGEMAQTMKTHMNK
jgi:hypothetical protein